MQSMFGWQGTTDYTNYLSLVDAVNYRASLPGGDAGVMSYMHQLAVDGGQVLVESWETEMLPADITAALVNVRLPCEPARAKSTMDLLEQQTTNDRRPRGSADVSIASSCVCPVDLTQQLYERYHTFVPAYTLAGGAWIRISAQIYNDMSDFEVLRDGVQNIVRAHCR
jgi:hypothetical protein